jgi:hypothetical protein
MVGFTTGSREEVPGKKKRKPVTRNDNDNNNKVVGVGNFYTNKHDNVNQPRGNGSRKLLSDRPDLTQNILS